MNDAVVDGPEAINEDPYTEAWMLKVDLDNIDELEELLSADEYQQFIEEEK